MVCECVSVCGVHGVCVVCVCECVWYAWCMSVCVCVYVNEVSVCRCGMLVRENTAGSHPMDGAPTAVQTCVFD